MPESKFTIRKAENGEYYFILVAQNGETVAVSEMYKTKQGAEKGIEAVKKLAGQAFISDETPSGGDK